MIGVASVAAIFVIFVPFAPPWPVLPPAALACYNAVLAAIPPGRSALFIIVGIVLAVLLGLAGFIFIGLFLFCC